MPAAMGPGNTSILVGAISLYAVKDIKARLFCQIFVNNRSTEEKHDENEREFNSSLSKLSL
jgi:hypothetical protein